jgi:hypothetical protein
MRGQVLWKALPEHNPTKLDSTQNTKPTAGDDFSNLNYILCHFNYYCKNINPKMEIPVSQIVYHTRVPLKIGCTLKQYLELKF